jgi:hypothetical protein
LQGPKTYLKIGHAALNPAMGYFESFEILQGLKSILFLQGLFSKQGIIAGIESIFKPT